MEIILGEPQIVAPEDRFHVIMKVLTRKQQEDEAIDYAMAQEKTIESLHPKKSDSRCLLCGHIYYNEEIEKCKRCQGRCRIMPADELRLSGRHPNRS